MFWAILRLVGANFTNILGPFWVFRRPKCPPKQVSFPKSAPHFAVLSLLVRTLVTFRSTRVKVFPDDGQDVVRHHSAVRPTLSNQSPKTTFPKLKKEMQNVYLNHDISPNSTKFLTKFFISGNLSAPFCNALIFRWYISRVKLPKFTRVICKVHCRS